MQLQDISVLITPLTDAQLDAFFVYLSEHLLQNGSEATGYFQPQPRVLSGFPPEREANFRKGMQIPVGTPGWRRAWTARDESGAILGHMDLRALHEPNTTHRCLLGLGVHHAHRKRGIAMALLAYAKEWARATANLDWIDLQVMSTNNAAIQLYRKAGYVQTGMIEDMFRLDGHSIGDVWMTLNVRRNL